MQLHGTRGCLTKEVDEFGYLWRQQVQSVGMGFERILLSVDFYNVVNLFRNE